MDKLAGRSGGASGRRGRAVWFAAAVVLGAVVLGVVGLRGAAAADFHGSITQGGSSVVVSLSTSGDKGYLTFSGSSGEQLGLGFTSDSFSYFQLALQDPGGATVYSSYVFSSTKDVNLPALGSTGTYTIVVDPGSATGSVTLTLSDDLTDTIAVGGSAKTATISRVGQNERLTFSGTSGENLGLAMTSSTITSGSVILYSPSGGQVGGTTVFTSAAGKDANWPSLPATGTYTIFVDPVGYTGSVTLTLSDDLTDTIAVGGSQRKYRSWTAQQKLEIVLAGMRGDRSVRDVCREHGIAETLYYGWRDKILEAGREALAGKEERSGERELKRKIGELERALGRKTYELEIAGKALRAWE